MKWKNVEVNNNRLLLSGTNLPGVSGDSVGIVACSVINTVEIYKISDNRFPPQWLPSSGAGGAWYQHEVPRGTKIGLVNIKFPRSPAGSPSAYGQQYADCRYAWMLYGDRCQYTGSRTGADHAANTPIGHFNAADQGFTVSVADEPCTADGGCVGGTICMVVRAPWIRVWGRVAPLPQDFAIDCNGAQGKYVRIHLPGANRIFSGAAYVNRAEPPALTPNQLACYGVIARAQTSTVPEYVISHDPADPIFYSSCLVRERNMEWEAPNTPPPPLPLLLLPSLATNVHAVFAHVSLFQGMLTWSGKATPDGFWVGTTLIPNRARSPYPVLTASMHSWRLFPVAGMHGVVIPLDFDMPTYWQ